MVKWRVCARVANVVVVVQFHGYLRPRFVRLPFVYLWTLGIVALVSTALNLPTLSAQVAKLTITIIVVTAFVTAVLVVDPFETEALALHVLVVATGLAAIVASVINFALFRGGMASGATAETWVTGCLVRE